MNGTDDGATSEPRSGLTDEQEALLSILNVVSGTLSVFGSSMIIYLVRKNPRQSPYRRILLGLSACDIMASISYALQPFLTPKDSVNARVYAVGNDAFCSVAGFLAQASFSTVWYNGFLSLYYLMTIRYGMKNSEFAGRYEKWIHYTAVCYNFLAAIVGVSIGLFSEAALGFGCWIAEYPKNCEDDDSCIGHFIGWFYGGIPTVVFFITIVICNMKIYRYVRSTVHKPSNPMSAEKKRRIKQLSTQGFFYVFTFFICYLWAFLAKVLESMGYGVDNEPDIYWLLVLWALFLPLQGFLNLFVYTRPSYLAIRDEYPNETRLWSVRKAWFGSISPNRLTDEEIASGSRTKPMIPGFGNSKQRRPVTGNSNPGGTSADTMKQMNLVAAQHQQEKRKKASEGFTKAIAKGENTLRTTPEFARIPQLQRLQESDTPPVLQSSAQPLPKSSIKKPASVKGILKKSGETSDRSAKAQSTDPVPSLSTNEGERHGDAFRDESVKSSQIERHRR